jgi:hypothetical protein
MHSIVVRLEHYMSDICALEIFSRCFSSLYAATQKDLNRPFRAENQQLKIMLPWRELRVINPIVARVRF